MRTTTSALRSTEEHLRAALEALTEVSVTQHLLPGVDISAPSWHHNREGVSVYVVLDRHVWDPRDWGERRGWMLSPSGPHAWQSVTVGRVALSRIPEERGRRTDREMLAALATGLASVLRELADTRVEHLLAAVIRSTLEGSQ